MEGKKKYVAIVLFLLIGLTIFAFASPSKEKVKEKENGNKTEEVVEDVEKDNDTTGEELEVFQEVTTMPLQNVNNNNVNNNNVDKNDVDNKNDNNEEIEEEFTEESIITATEITLKEDTTLEETLTIEQGQTKTINLNGKTLTITNEEAGRRIQNYGTLNITNGKIVVQDKVANGLVDNYGTLNISNVEYEDNGETTNGSLRNRNGKITVKDTTVTMTATNNGNAFIYSEGELQVENTTITSNSNRAYGMSVASGTATIKDTTIIGNHGGLAAVGGEVEVNNLTYESAVHYGIYVANNNAEGTNVTINGGKFVGQLQGIYVGNELDKGDVVVEINGGEFSSKTGKGAILVSKGTSSHNFDVTIKGGTFKDTNVEQYIEAGYRQNSEYKVLETTEIDSIEYLKEVITNSGTYTLESDINLNNEILKVSKNINLTINMNGKTISGLSTSGSTSSLFRVENGATLSLIGNGTITFKATSPDTEWDPEGFPTYANNTIANSGTLIIDGPTIINSTPNGGASYVIDNYAGGNLTIENGTITQTGGDIAIRLNTASEIANNVTVNNGTITGRRAFWIHLAGSNANVAPIVNLTINNGTFTSSQNNGFALYSYSYGNSYANVKATFNGGTFNGYVAFGGGYKGDKETVEITGGTFNNGIGRYLENDGWEDLQ